MFNQKTRPHEGESIDIMFYRIKFSLADYRVATCVASRRGRGGRYSKTWLACPQRNTFSDFLRQFYWLSEYLDGAIQGQETLDACYKRLPPEV